MEALIDGLSSFNQQQFQARDGTYKDVCKWSGIQCNGRRQVTEIMWNFTKQDKFILIGKLSFVDFPPHTKGVNIYAKDSNADYFHLKFLGSDTSALPRGLESFNIENVFIKSLDLRRLPASLETLQAKSCGVSGTCCLTALPTNLQAAQLTENFLEGSISLDRLPPELISLELSFNELSGTINLKRLPKTLRWISLDNNHFYGSVDVNYLSRDMQTLFLQKNELSGIFNLTSPSENLRSISIRGNAFKCPVVVSRRAFSVVDVDYAEMGDVVDDNGVPYTLDEIELVKTRREEELRKNFERIKRERLKNREAHTN